MSRRSEILTDDAVKERNDRYFGPARNKRRRDRYKADASFRRSAIDAVRAAYRKQRARQGEEVRDEDCRINVPLLTTIGKIRSVVLGEHTEISVLTLTVDELAIALIRHKRVLQRWMRAGLFPFPTIPIKKGKTMELVYSSDQAQRLLETFGHHTEDSQYYKKDHVVTRSGLFAAMRLNPTS